MKTCKTGQTGVRSVHGTNVNFLVLILYYSSLKCYHWGELDKRYVGPLYTNFGSSYEAIITSKLKKKKTFYNTRLTKKKNSVSIKRAPDHLTCLLRNLYAGQEATEMDMELLTGSKLGKEYIKAVYCHPAYLT